MEMMLVRILIYVCALMSFDVLTYTASVKDSSEQTALQEALLLVDILKAEYARVLRERSLIKDNKLDEKDLETCATTTALTDAVTHTRTDNPIHHIEHSPRRRLNSYRDYYGRHDPPKAWRRMDYENIFGPQPGDTLSTSTVSQPTSVPDTNSPITATSTTVSNTAMKTVSEISTSSTLSHTSSSSTSILSTTVSSTTPKSIVLSLTLKPTEISIPITLSSTLIPLLNMKPTTLISKSASNRATTLNTPNNKKSQTKRLAGFQKTERKNQKLDLYLEETTVTSTDEPEQAQVAAELENELEAAIEPSTFSPSSHRWSMTWRPTTRVHLAKSTRYDLPLPENHAFCYTNPKSSLCRTFIK